MTTTDCLLTVDGGLLVKVVGQLKVVCAPCLAIMVADSLFSLYLQADNDPVHGFTQTFYLKQIGDSLFVMNDIFRLALHNLPA